MFGVGAVVGGAVVTGAVVTAPVAIVVASPAELMPEFVSVRVLVPLLLQAVSPRATPVATSATRHAVRDRRRSSA